MNISPDIFRPPTAPNKHSTVIREWFHSSHSNRLDRLQTDPEVTGLLCFNDGLFTTLETFFGFVFYFIPYWDWIRLAMFIYLLLPNFNGAKQLYDGVIRNLLD